MNIRTLKTFKWSFNGNIRQFEADHVYDVDDKHAAQMISAGYAKELPKHAENKMVTVDYVENNPSDIKETADHKEETHKKAGRPKKEDKR